jgi:MFS family permease
MWVQSGVLFLTALTREFEVWLIGSLLLGLGTAMVHPSLIAAVSDASHPTWRARSLSVDRFWRDLGYAIGALLAGVIADFAGLSWAIESIAILTFLSGLADQKVRNGQTIGSKRMKAHGTLRAGFRLFWRWTSRRRGGRPIVEIPQLIREAGRTRTTSPARIKAAGASADRRCEPS